MTDRKLTRLRSAPAWRRRRIRIYRYLAASEWSVADNRRAGLFDPEVGKKLRPQQSGEGIAVTPEQEQLEDGDHDRRRKTLGGHENVKEQDVHDDRTENRQTKGNEASDEQEQAAEYLQAADYVNVTAGKNTFTKSPARFCGIGGMGMKCKNAFEPNTTKMSPSRMRAMRVAIFICRSSFRRLRRCHSKFSVRLIHHKEIDENFYCVANYWCYYI